MRLFTLTDPERRRLKHTGAAGLMFPRSALLSALLALAAYAGSAWLTHDFQVWTAEGARRLEVALQPIAAPARAD